MKVSPRPAAKTKGFSLAAQFVALGSSWWSINKRKFYDCLGALISEATVA